MFVLLSSLWLGVLTSISPCPLATNIATVSFLGRKVGKPRRVLMSGVIYTLGRTFFYTALGVVLSFSLDAIPSVSMFLQTKANYILAPLLILIGLVLLNVIRIPLPSFGLSDEKNERLQKLGLFGNFLLGIIFAAALCPVSAALFFGNLIQSDGSVLSMLLFGIGTGLPVLFFAAVIAFSMNKLGAVYKKISVFEKYARIFTGVLFIAVGLYQGRFLI